MTEDADIITHVDELVDEEHTLEERAHGDGKSLSTEDNAAETRDPSTVEGYRQ